MSITRQGREQHERRKLARQGVIWYLEHEMEGLLALGGCHELEFGHDVADAVALQQQRADSCVRMRRAVSRWFQLSTYTMWLCDCVRVCVCAWVVTSIEAQGGGLLRAQEAIELPVPFRERLGREPEVLDQLRRRVLHRGRHVHQHPLRRRVEGPHADLQRVAQLYVDENSLAQLSGPSVAVRGVERYPNGRELDLRGRKVARAGGSQTIEPAHTRGCQARQVLPCF